MMVLHTVFSVDGSRYLDWQAQLLAYSYMKAGQHGPLTRIVSSDAEPTPFPGHTHQAPPWAIHPITGDNYPPMNKPSGLLHWWLNAHPEGDAFLIIDPDFLFLRPIAVEVSVGRPIGQRADFLNPRRNPEGAPWDYPGMHPNVDPVGVPLIVHSADLERLLRRWFGHTCAMRCDPSVLKQADWTSEMWAYAIAAADLALHHVVVKDLMHHPADNTDTLPLLHYTWRVDVDDWHWDKRDYLDGAITAPAAPPPSAPPATRRLIEILNEFLRSQELTWIS